MSRQRKYNMSKDGVVRTTVSVAIRLTRSEFDRLQEIANDRVRGGMSVANFLNGKLADAVYSTLDEDAINNGKPKERWVVKKYRLYASHPINKPKRLGHGQQWWYITVHDNKSLPLIFYEMEVVGEERIHNDWYELEDKLNKKLKGPLSDKLKRNIMLFNAGIAHYIEIEV